MAWFLRFPSFLRMGDTVGRARGSVYKRGSRWVLQTELDAGEFGTRRREYRSFATKREAEKARTRFLADVDAGRNPTPDMVQFGAYAERWFAGRERLRPATRKRYRNLLDKWVLPDLERLPVRSVRPDHIRAVLTKMREAGLAGATRQQARALMGAIFQQAVKDEIREANPVRAVERPSTVSRARDGLLGPDDVAAILSHADGTIWYLPLLLAAWTGARRSEILGLRWSDIDFTSGEIRIMRGRQRVDGVTVVDDPKTARGRRTVRLPADVLLLVGELRDALPVRNLDGWACTHPTGEPLSPDGMSQAFKRFAGNVGKGDACLHHLRHAAGTDLVDGGLDLSAASMILGHADPAFTARQYVHPERWAAERAAAVLSARRGKVPDAPAANGCIPLPKRVAGESSQD